MADMLDSTKLLKTYFDFSRIGSFVLREWESTIDITLRNIIQSETFLCKGENEGLYEVSFINYNVRGSANYPNQDNSIVECRRRHTSYLAAIYVDIRMRRKGSKEWIVSEKDCYLFSIPLMLGTKYCELYNKSATEVLLIKQCNIDPYGYYIIDGKEKCGNLKRRLRMGKAMLSDDTERTQRKKNRDAKTKVSIESPQLTIVCTMVCRRSSGTSSQVLVREGNNKVIEADLSLNLISDVRAKNITEAKKVLNTPVNISFLIDLFMSENAKLISGKLKPLAEVIKTGIASAKIAFNNKVYKANSKIISANRALTKEHNNLYDFPIKHVSNIDVEDPDTYRRYNIGVKERNEARTVDQEKEQTVEYFKSEMINKESQRIQEEYNNSLPEDNIYTGFHKLGLSDRCSRIKELILSLYSMPVEYKALFESYVIATVQDYKDAHSRIPIKNSRPQDYIKTLAL